MKSVFPSNKYNSNMNTSNPFAGIALSKSTSQG